MQSIENIILKFKNGSVDSLDFPCTLTSQQRKEVHLLAAKHALDHCSCGYGERRFIRVTKRKVAVVGKKEEEGEGEGEGESDVYTLDNLPVNMIRRCKKDFKLPISALYEDLFLYQVKLFQDVYHTKDIFDFFIQQLNQYKQNRADTNSTATLLDHIDTVKDQLMTALTSTDALKAFTSPQAVDRYKLPNHLSVSNQPVYRPEHSNEYFISADLCSADYASLHYHDPRLVLNHSSWTTLLSQFTNNEYLHKSKKFRQFILGEVNSSHTRKVMQWLTYILYKRLVERRKGTKVCCLLSDEIVVRVEEGKEMKEVHEVLQDLINNGLPKGFPEFRLEAFRVVQLGNHPYYAKESFMDIQQANYRPSQCQSKSIKFKSVPPHLLPQCYKYYFKMPITDEDLKIWDNGEKKYVLMKKPLFFKEDQNPQPNETKKDNK